ncbi:hypothetical protein SZ64_09040 [Erythrobacter sp. SG61-1L]|uniref:hypothetical protein n=1 Tax=Erythrobacter sp. SG61-1L TaxID=1603897 RepID=UPI0006C90EC8|nr:hypothetical protein [Erythrobacter sp. SG61-1L]KPL68252.1 hypothetical protein SZ64_09040 [Erythrobacter sp. SG61-1L]
MFKRRKTGAQGRRRTVQSRARMEAWLHPGRTSQTSKIGLFGPEIRRSAIVAVIAPEWIYLAFAGAGF